VGRQAIITDPNWRQGAYEARGRPEHGLAVARMVGHVTYLSEFSMREKFGRALQDEAKSKRTYRALFPEFFKVESYLHYQGDSFVGRFDPNSYLYITKALDTFDLLEGRPPAEVFEHIRAHFLVLSFESDWLYPPDQSRALVKALKRSNAVVTYLNLDTRYGHDSFLIQNPDFSKAVRNFFESEYRRQRGGLKKATQAIRI
jgi:homoserine O-acetyltransferase